MPGAHPHSPGDHVVAILQEQEGCKKRKGTAPGGACTKGEIPREKEMSRFPPTPDLQLAESRTGHAGLLLPAASLPVVQLVDVNRLWWGGKETFSPRT